MLLPEVTKLATSCLTCNQRYKWTVVFSDETYQKLFKKYYKRKKTDQLNMIEIAKEFVGDNQARLRTFGSLWEH